MRILRYRIDIVSLMLALAILGVQLAAFFLRLPWFMAIPLIVLTRWTHLVEHNHSHLPISWSRTLDEVFGWVLFLSGGVPLEAYRVFHVQTHHRYANRAADWTSPFAYEGTRFPDRPVNFAY
jgi:fatty acid desaturase